MSESIKDEKETTIISYYVTDQGNGGWVCQCGASGYEAYVMQCPKCEKWAIDGGTYISVGGSDF